MMFNKIFPFTKKNKNYLLNEPLLLKKNNLALQTKNLSFSYFKMEKPAVNNITLSINAGEYVVLIGHNGSGKSTFAKVITNVLENYTGEIAFFGNLRTKTNFKAIAKFLGIVFQNPENQFFGATVRDDIAFGLENNNLTSPEIHKIIEEVSLQLGIHDILDKSPLELSGGQKQKVAIASVLALKPEIIIFDESTSMLDPKSKIDIKQIMIDLKTNFHKTVISITHDMEEILFADQVIIFDKAKLAKIGSPKEVLQDNEFFKSIGLNIPNILQLLVGLQKKGLSLKHTFSEKELVEQLWKLHSIK